LAKFKNLVLFIAMLAVDVAAVRERHCAAAVSQQWRRLWLFAACAKAGDAHFE